MQVLHVETTCTEDGTTTLRDLPVYEGDAVEVIVIPRSSIKSAQECFALRGEPLEYLHPFEPVAEADGEAAR